MSQSRQGCAISYDEFKLRLDFARHAQRIDVAHYYIIDLLLSSIIGFDAYALTVVQTLVDAIFASNTDFGRAKFGVADDYASNGSIRQMTHKLQKLITRHSNAISDLAKVNDASSPSLEIIDYVEDKLSSINAAYEYTLKRKFAIKKLSTPSDPNMLALFMLALEYSDLTLTLHHDLIASYPVLENEPYKSLYKPLAFADIWSQLKKMLGHIDFLDTNGEDLKFNIQGLKQSKEVLGMFTDVLCIVYSSEFNNGIIKIRTGKDDVIDIKHAKSFSDEFEKTTMPLAWYNEKYNKIINN